MKPRPYAALLRVSTRMQAEAATIETQAAEIRAWVVRQGGDPDRDVLWFRDEAVSGDVPIWDRPGTSELREAVEARLVTTAVVAYHLDRVNREDVISYFELENLCSEYGLALRTVLDGIDTSTDMGQLLGGLGALLARKQKRELVERMHAGKLRSVRAGRWPGRPPYGHRRTDEGTLEPDPAHVTVVQEMVRLLRDERVSATELARILNERGIGSPHRKEWHATIVLRVLRNPSLVGRAIYNRTRRVRKRGRDLGHASRPETDHITVPCPPILDEATWQRVQELLNERTSTVKTGVTAGAMMLGRVVCAMCGERFYAQRVRARYGKREWNYYYSHRWTGPNADCTGRGNMPRNKLDDQIWKRIVEAARDTETWRAEVEIQLERDTTSEPLADARKALKEAESALARLEDAHFIRQTITAERYDALQPRLNAAVYEARRELARHEQQAARQAAARQKMDRTTLFLEQTKREIEHFTMEERQAMCLRLIREVVLYKEGRVYASEIVWLP